MIVLRKRASTGSLSDISRIRQHGLGLRIRAGPQLSGRIDRLSCLLRQKVPIWQNGAWSAGLPSSNPAWIFRYVALGLWRGLEAEGNREITAGAGLAESEIDDDTIKAWGAFCDSEGLTCNLVVRDEGVLDVLESIARCGRATLSWASGRLGVIWEDDGASVSALVTPAQIVLNSYQIQWLGSGDIADVIVGSYIDASASYERREVRSASDLVTVRSETRIDLAGITDRSRAQAAVDRQARIQWNNRRRHEWEMPASALPAGRGDVVWMTHSLIDGGETGRLVSISMDRAEVTLSAPVELSTGSQLVIAMPDGGMYQSTNLRYRDPAAQETLRLNPPLPPPNDLAAWEPMDCAWRFYNTSGRSALRIVEIRPSSEGIVRIAAVDFHASGTPGTYTWDDLITWDAWSTGTAA